MRTFAHIVNPVAVDESSDLFAAQPITFETMRIARNFAHGEVGVDLFATSYSEDREIIPDSFQTTAELDRSVLDFGSFQQARKLPLIKDILDRLFLESEAEYLIYTNADIALKPHFYLTVDKIASFGYDAFLINRRTISAEFKSKDQVPIMYAQLGIPHPGTDGFIFKREIYPNLELGTACIGARYFAVSFVANLICNANRFGRFTDLDLTFHLGDDRAWLSSEFSDFAEHNRTQFAHNLAKLKATRPLPDDPYLKLIIDRNLIESNSTIRRCMGATFRRANRIYQRLRMLRKANHRNSTYFSLSKDKK